jgi:hypothetical protein
MKAIQVMLQALRNIRDDADRLEVQSGICYNAEREFQRLAADDDIPAEVYEFDVEQWLKRQFRDMDLHPTYPVEPPDEWLQDREEEFEGCSQGFINQTIFEDTLFLWEGAYGDNRRALLADLIERAEEQANAR